MWIALQRPIFLLEVFPGNTDLFCLWEEGDAGKGVDGLHWVASEDFQVEPHVTGGQAWYSDIGFVADQVRKQFAKLYTALLKREDKWQKLNYDAIYKNNYYMYY